jgi:TPR repeat protein
MTLRDRMGFVAGVLAMAGAPLAAPASGQPGGPSARARECFESAAASRHTDPLRAALHFQCACDAGLAVGCYETAHVYLAGTGVARNPDRAMEVWQGACRAMEPSDCEDAVIPETPDDLLVALQQGCAAGSAYACTSIGYVFEEGVGRSPNPRVARHYYSLAEPTHEQLRAREEEIERGRRAAIARAEARAAARRAEPASTGDPEVDAAKAQADRDRELPAVREWQAGLSLMGAEAQACVPVSFRGSYYVRVRGDGSIGTALVRPKGEIAACIERAMGRMRVTPPPGGRDTWVALGMHLNRGTPRP